MYYILKRRQSELYNDATTFIIFIANDVLNFFTFILHCRKDKKILTGNCKLQSQFSTLHTSYLTNRTEHTKKNEKT